MSPLFALGLAILESGGDFADGVIAYLGASAGAETFATFDVTASEHTGTTRLCHGSSRLKKACPPVG